MGLRQPAQGGEAGDDEHRLRVRLAGAVKVPRADSPRKIRTMNIYGQFPAVRMRRMRRNDFSRRLMREHRLSADDLIYPVFVLEGRNRTQKVASMPGVERMTVDRLLPLAEQCLKLRVPVMALFPVIVLFAILEEEFTE